MSTSNINPPKWPLRLLRFFIRKQFLEEIEGDLEELFHDNARRFSLRKARRIYTWEMLKLMRPILIKNLEGVERLNQYGMFKNYFKVSIRGLMKNPLNSFINIFGLALAIAVSVFVYAFAHFSYGTDQFHEHKQTVYLVTFFADRDGKMQQYGLTPRPLGEMLRADFTHIKKVARVDDRNVIVKFGDHVFHEKIRFTDPEFLQMMTFPMKWGVSGSLNDVNGIILSETMSEKYFGDENPVGQSILIKFDPERSKTFKVTGVAKAFPEARSNEFNFLINFENFRIADPRYDFHDWSANINATLIQVENAADITSLQEAMGKYKKLQNGAVQEDWAVSSFAFEPLATLHERTEQIRDDIARSSRGLYESVIYLIVVGSFMLALACFNYINIAIVSAARRLKEIGVRKSIGATRKVVIAQFLSENIVVTFFALALGLLLGITVVIPGFNSIWDAFSLDVSLTDPILWLYLVAILIVTAIASGIYPSLYISRFQVAGILKGSVKFGQKNPVTKIFLGLQLVFACIFITIAVTFTQNNDYIANRPWGYDQAQVLYAALPDAAAHEKMYPLLAQDPNVVLVSGSKHHLGKSHAPIIIHFPTREYEVDQIAVDAEYFKTMGIVLTQGRTFHYQPGSDRQSAVVNELFVKNLSLESPVGSTFKIDSLEYEVVGVVKDFHSYSFARPVRPTIFTVAEKEQYRYLSLRTRAGAEAKVHKDLRTKWAELFPEIPFDGGYQEDVWGSYFEQVAVHGLVWRTFAFVAVALASLGLYGLIKFNVAGRVREFNIRKVLGAGIKNLATNITKQYVLLFAIALAAGAPLGYFLIKYLFDTIYWYHMPVDFSGSAIAAGILVTVFLVTAVTQVLKVTRANPVEGLKIE